MPRPVVAKDPWGRWINHRTPTAPKGQNEIAQGRAKRRPGYGRATGALDRSHRAIRSAQILAVFEDAKRYISRIDLRTGIETTTHLESTRTGDLCLEKADRLVIAHAWTGPTNVNRVALAGNTAWVRNDSQIGHATEFPSIGCQ